MEESFPLQMKGSTEVAWVCVGVWDRELVSGEE